MIEDTVQNDPNIVPVSLFEQLQEGGIPAKQRIDGIIIVGMITMVGGRGKDRVEIESRDPQGFQVIQVLRNPKQIAALETIWRGGRIPGLEGQISGRITCTFCKTVWKDLIKVHVILPEICPSS